MKGKEMKETNNLFTLTVLKAMEILNCFEDDRHEIGIKEMAEQIGLSQSSVYRIIQSLEYTGFVFQNNDNKKYRLGTRAIRIKSKVKCLDIYKDIAIENMKELGKLTGETVNLGVLDCDNVIYIHKIECEHLLRPNYNVGSKYPSCSTGLGKVFVSELPKSIVRVIYENNEEKLNMTFEDFWNEMSDIRKNGFATDDEEFCEGLRCVAAPIRAPGGSVIFSMSVSAPKTRMSDEKYKETAKLVKQYAAKATSEIRMTDV